MSWRGASLASTFTRMTPCRARPGAALARKQSAVFLASAALGWAQQGVIRVNVDARDAPRKLIHVALSLPAVAGPMTLLYPQWIPGEHGPTGPIADVVNLKIRAKDQTVAWRRDSANLFAFHVNVPAGGATR